MALRTEFVLFALLLLLAPIASAQQVVSARSGLIYYVEGPVSLDTRTIGYVRPNQYPQMEALQTLKTAGGRAEVLLGPGAVLWLDHNSTMRFADTSLANTLMVVDGGSAIVEIKDEQAGDRVLLAAGGTSAELVKKGVYRFDAGGLRLRVYEGQAAAGAVLKSGQQTAIGSEGAERFDRKDLDDFHYWAAYRSLRLRAESGGSASNWKGDGRWALSHAGFDVTFDRGAGAARMQYLTAARAGTLFYAEGALFVAKPTGSGPPGQLPFQLGEGDLVRSARGRAEILLGPGVVLRIGEESEVKLLDSGLAHPSVRLERGSAMIEVAHTGRDARVRVHVGESMTEIAKKGLYRFDSGGELRVYGGEAHTKVADARLKTKADQMRSVFVAAEPVKFDKEERDALFRWSEARSFALFRYAGDFIADWDTRGWGNQARHAQFEPQPYRGGRRR